MPTTGNRLLAVTPSVSPAVLTRSVFSRLAGLFRVCARLFSQQLQRALPDRDLDVQLLLLPPLPFDVDVQFVQTGLQARESGLHGRQHVRRIRRVPRPGCGRRHVSRRHRRHAGFPLPGRRGLPPGCLRHGVFPQVGVHSMGTIFQQYRRLVSNRNCVVGTRRPFLPGYLVMRACPLR